MGANLISHNYLCKPDRHQGWPRNTELVDTDWVICPLLFRAEGLWELHRGEPLCRCTPTSKESKNHVTKAPGLTYASNMNKAKKAQSKA